MEAEKLARPSTVKGPLFKWFKSRGRAEIFRRDPDTLLRDPYFTTGTGAQYLRSVGKDIEWVREEFKTFLDKIDNTKESPRDGKKEISNCTDSRVTNSNLGGKKRKSSNSQRDGSSKETKISKRSSPQVSSVSGSQDSCQSDLSSSGSNSNLGDVDAWKSLNPQEKFVAFSFRPSFKSSLTGVSVDSSLFPSKISIRKELRNVLPLMIFEALKSKESFDWNELLSSLQDTIDTWSTPPSFTPDQIVYLCEQLYRDNSLVRLYKPKESFNVEELNPNSHYLYLDLRPSKVKAFLIVPNKEDIQELTKIDYDSDEEGVEDPTEVVQPSRSELEETFSKVKGKYEPRNVLDAQEMSHHSTSPTLTVYPEQKNVAERILKAVEEAFGSALYSFSKMDFFILVPSFISLHEQTVERLEQIGLVSKAREYVSKSNLSVSGKEAFNSFKQKVKENPNTLFVLINDEAHWAAGFQDKEKVSQAGATDFYINDPDIRGAGNVITLLVTATPYNLLTCNSQIPVNHYISWFPHPNDQNSSAYFGIDNYAEAERFAHDPQFDLLVGQYVSKNKVKKKEVGDARHRVLERDYQAAMLLTRGERSVHSGYPTKETAKMVKELVKENEGGTGIMILLRVISKKQAKEVERRLKEARDSLGYQNHFEVVMDVSDSTTIGEKLDSQFLQRIQKWRGDETFEPKCYEDLLDLPCILILVEKGRMGDTFPKSLQFYDLRLRYGERCNIRASLEQDLGRVCRYISPEEENLKMAQKGSYPLPFVLLGNGGARIFQSARNRNRLIEMLPDQRVSWKKNVRKKEDSHLFWRENLIPNASKSNHYDSKNYGMNQRRFLLAGRPQIGKTGAFLYFLQLLRNKISSEEIVIFDDDEELVSEEGTQVMMDSTRNGQHPIFGHFSPRDFPKIVSANNKYLAKASGNALIYLDTLDSVPLGMRPTPNTKTMHVPEDFLQSSFRCFNAKVIKPSFSHLKIPCATDTFTLTNVKMHLHIPEGQRALFQFETVERNCSLEGFILDKLDIRFPIFVPSYERPRDALINYHDALKEKSTDDEPKKALIIIVVKPNQLDKYKESWPRHIFLELPSNEGGVGEARHQIMNLCYAMKKRPSHIWMLDDSILLFKELVLPSDSSNSNSNANESKTIAKDVSLYRVLSHVERHPSEEDFDKFGMFGFFRFSQYYKNLKNAFKNTFLYSAYLINLNRVAPKNFSSSDMIMEDMRFEMELNKEKKLVMCKFNRFMMIKKHMGGGAPKALKENEAISERGMITNFPPNEILSVYEPAKVGEKCSFTPSTLKGLETFFHEQEPNSSLLICSREFFPPLQIPRCKTANLDLDDVLKEPPREDFDAVVIISQSMGNNPVLWRRITPDAENGYVESLQRKMKTMKTTKFYVIRPAIFLAKPNDDIEEQKKFTTIFSSMFPSVKQTWTLASDKNTFVIYRFDQN